ncbi:NAD(P)-dependent oxidoreductase [Prochlorococcus sp. AH-716-B20]|nr:NAD(P)-dependent oxidoreductase [Prochlorococcus sp. AH-716-B20]
MREKIHIIGSNGFIGKNLIKNFPRKEYVLWSHSKKEDFNFFDLLNNETWTDLINQKPKIVILLSWPGLPNYNEYFHVNRNLPLCLKLVEILKDNGLQKLIITGTCYEYGLINGQIKEECITKPLNQYAIAKDTLRKSLFEIHKNTTLKICWLRIFYVYGKDQNKNSLYPSLLDSIKSNSSFAISSGRQIRDFVKVETISGYINLFLNSDKANGIFNGGSGNPVSIYEFVKKIIEEYKSNIKIKRNFYPDREDEPSAFWADVSKIKSLYNLQEQNKS